MPRSARYCLPGSLQHVISRFVDRNYWLADDIDRNVERMIRWARRAGKLGARLVVFPEGCMTGYDLRDVADRAVAWRSSYVDALQGVAGRERLAISFGFLERRGRRFAVSQGTVTARSRLCYRKCHLT